MTECTTTSRPSSSTPAASQPRIIGSCSRLRPTPRSDQRSWWLSEAARTLTVVQPEGHSGSGRSPTCRTLSGSSREKSVAKAASMARSCRTGDAGVRRASVLGAGRGRRPAAVAGDRAPQTARGRPGRSSESAPARLRLPQSAVVAKVTARASRQIPASPERVLELLRDYREVRPALLTPNYSAYRVEAGGRGGGTVIGYHFAAGGRERDYR